MKQAALMQINITTHHLQDTKSDMTNFTNGHDSAGSYDNVCTVVTQKTAVTKKTVSVLLQATDWDCIMYVWNQEMFQGDIFIYVYTGGISVVLIIVWCSL